MQNPNPFVELHSPHRAGVPNPTAPQALLYSNIQIHSLANPGPDFTEETFSSSNPSVACSTTPISD